MVYMNLHQAKTALPSLVEAAMQGDEVIIAQDGKPMVRLVLQNAYHRHNREGLMERALMQSEPISGKRLVDVLPDETPVQDGGGKIFAPEFLKRGWFLAVASLMG